MEVNKERLCQFCMSDSNFVVVCLFPLALGMDLHKEKNIHANSYICVAVGAIPHTNPHDVRVLISGTCEYVTFLCKRTWQN